MAFAAQNSTVPAAGVKAADREVTSVKLSAPGLRCAGCIAGIERALNKLEGVEEARVNMTLKQVRVDYLASRVSIEELISAAENAGYEVRQIEHDLTAPSEHKAESQTLLKSLAVAGFAAGNVMLLSVSVWSGATEATRDLLHWISALIALPTVVYAGQPFFKSAWKALGARRLNMEVPISLAVILAAAMSLYETITGGEHAYFDAAVMLLFFLLAGRYLDHMMRARARSALADLVGLEAKGATVVTKDGARQWQAMTEIAPGMQVAIAAGERVPVDGRVIKGLSDLDRSLVTGETVPVALRPGSIVEAGTINLSGPLVIEVTATGSETTLARIADLLSNAQQSKARYVRLADQAARIYAPLVHLAALLTFLGWMWMSGDWHLSLLTAIAVLIITCPCALGLAVPAVQVVATGRLFEHGILVKDGSALERLAKVDVAIFDKTGTLTIGNPQVCQMDPMPTENMAIAFGLARESKHPLAKALGKFLEAKGIAPATLTDSREHPGLGMEGTFEGQTVRLGSAEWCGVNAADEQRARTGSLLCLRIADGPVQVFVMQDELRPDASETVEALRARGMRIVLLSGDRPEVVEQVARDCHISEFRAEWRPEDKAAYVQSLQETGAKVLMVGDGINDAPALGSAHASMAPSTAADITGVAADMVFLGKHLMAIPRAIDMAKAAQRRVHENFALAVIYNLIAVPIAVLGFASPLVAAIAMSSSSLLVTTNALRLRLLHVVGSKS